MAPCIAVLGGSFDPIHNGHLALARHAGALLQADELRVIPAGAPWQKENGLQAAPEHRVEMILRAFADQDIHMVLDRQEIHRQRATYTIDTLRGLREEFGAQASITFLLGADQMQTFHTWHCWRQLFDYAHFCALSRPGFTLDQEQLSQEVAAEFSRRGAPIAELRASPHGLIHLANGLAVNISATEIRAILQRGDKPRALIPAVVLDYIEDHHLYQNHRNYRN